MAFQCRRLRGTTQPTSETNSRTQNAVITTAAIRLSTQRISLEPKIEIMKAAKVDGTRPNGGRLTKPRLKPRIMPAKARMARMTQAGPRIA
jgi:hypothetical protein